MPLDKNVQILASGVNLRDLKRLSTRGRQRYGNTEYRSAEYRFCGSGNGSGIEIFCGTVLRYEFLELAVNGIGSG